MAPQATYAKTFWRRMAEKVASSFVRRHRKTWTRCPSSPDQAGSLQFHCTSLRSLRNDYMRQYLYVRCINLKRFTYVKVRLHGTASHICRSSNAVHHRQGRCWTLATAQVHASDFGLQPYSHSLPVLMVSRTKIAGITMHLLIQAIGFRPLQHKICSLIKMIHIDVKDMLFYLV